MKRASGENLSGLKNFIQSEIYSRWNQNIKPLLEKTGEDEEDKKM